MENSERGGWVRERTKWGRELGDTRERERERERERTKREREGENAGDTEKREVGRDRGKETRRERMQDRGLICYASAPRIETSTRYTSNIYWAHE